jgi:L-ascorbate metabolism protein UlaG (beta-lactamase superfamily)
MSVKLTWHGHATIGLETGDYKLSVDPFFTGNPTATITEGEVEADFILVPAQRSFATMKFPPGWVPRV